MKTETVVFAAGCFWGVEEKFRTTHGVLKTRVGYTGGKTENPTYEQVCAKETGHAEAVEVIFDPEKISYEALLNIFWNMHDPTTKDRQGPDVGTQYRSAIFTTTPEQLEIAKTSKENQPRSVDIVTEIEPLTNFYEAEEYHQQYLKKRNQKTCDA